MSEKKRKGFAVMDPKIVRAISAEGGKAAHAKGTAHTFTREEAAEAGRKGGYVTAAKRRAKRQAESKEHVEPKPEPKPEESA